MSTSYHSNQVFVAAADSKQKTQLSLLLLQFRRHCWLNLEVKPVTVRAGSSMSLLGPSSRLQTLCSCWVFFFCHHLPRTEDQHVTVVIGSLLLPLHIEDQYVTVGIGSLLSPLHIEDQYVTVGIGSLLSPLHIEDQHVAVGIGSLLSPLHIEDKHVAVGIGSLLSPLHIEDKHVAVGIGSLLSPLHTEDQHVAATIGSLADNGAHRGLTKTLLLLCLLSRLHIEDQHVAATVRYLPTTIHKRTDKTLLLLCLCCHRYTLKIRTSLLVLGLWPTTVRTED